MLGVVLEQSAAAAQVEWQKSRLQTRVRGQPLCGAGTRIHNCGIGYGIPQCVQAGRVISRIGNAKSELFQQTRLL